MPENIYLKQPSSLEWNMKPCRGRQRKTLGRVVDDLFVALDKAKCLQKVERGDTLAASFIGSVYRGKGNVCCMLRDLIVKLSYLSFAR